MRILLLIAVFSLAGCGLNVNEILAGATHACGTIHVEGYFTDSQGEVIVAKAPDDWTPEQVDQFCANQ